MAIISYYDVTNTALKVAHCNDIACTSAELSYLDADGVVGMDTSIVIGVDGLPIISYYREDSGNLKVAHCNDLACTSASKTPLDVVGDVGAGSSLTIGTDGLPIIVYKDWTNENIKIAHCDDLTCSGATISVLEIEYYVGFPSITIGVDGLPIFSYHEEGEVVMDDGIYVAHCENVECTSITFNFVAQAESPSYPSIAIGMDGVPIISIGDSDSNPTVAHCSDITCSSARIILLAHIGFGDYIHGDVITIGVDGMPIISYGDPWDNLHVLHCSNRFCLPYWRQW
jgi:hypothetical protein